MKKQISTIMLGILMLVSATAMYSGESISFEINLTNPVYTVYGNSSDLTGLNVSFENGNITINTDPLMASDNFTLIFFDEVTREVIKEVNTGGGGGSRTRYVYKNATVYEPVYINDTEPTEFTCDADIDDVVEEEIETGLRWRYVLVGGILGTLLTSLIWWIATRKKRR